MTRQAEHSDLAAWNDQPPVGADLHDKGLPPVSQSLQRMEPYKWPAMRRIWRSTPEHADEIMAMLFDPMNPNGRTYNRPNPKHPANRRTA